MKIHGGSGREHANNTLYGCFPAMIFAILLNICFQNTHTLLIRLINVTSASPEINLKYMAFDESRLKRCFTCSIYGNLPRDTTIITWFSYWSFNTSCYLYKDAKKNTNIKTSNNLAKQKSNENIKRKVLFSILNFHDRLIFNPELLNQTSYTLELKQCKLPS